MELNIKNRIIHGLGEIDESSGMRFIDKTSDNRFTCGQNGVDCIAATGDGKLELVSMGGRTIAHVNSALGYSAYYDFKKCEVKRPVKAVLMDLDGTTVHSEEFWIWIIQKSIASLMHKPGFEFENSDLPFISGNSVLEHLNYAINKYCPGSSLKQARYFYDLHTQEEMAAILEGSGRVDAFKPAPQIKEFLVELKAMDIKIALVTSGLYTKAWPEILSAFKTLNLGDPKEFYDAIITAGTKPGKGRVGTLGELAPKPHPWLYSEAFCVGLGMDRNDSDYAIGIEDSGAGISSIRLAGIPAIGIAGGNIIQSGTKALCNAFFADFQSIIHFIKG